MNKKFISRFISFILVFTVLCCGSVSASAYNPVITIYSSGWVATDSSVLSYKYPEFSVDTGDNCCGFFSI